jgi:flagellin
MPSSIASGGRIRTNIPALNAYNSLQSSNRAIAKSQLRLSTGKRINAASDDVAGYITARSLNSRNVSLKAALNAVGEAKNVTSISQDALDNITNLLTQIKDAASQASSGALGTDEKVALAKAAFRLSEQIQTVVDSTVFGGQELLNGAFSGDFVIGVGESNSLITIEVDLSSSNSTNFNTDVNFELNSDTAANFGGITGLNLASLDSVSDSDLGMFSAANISTTLTSLSDALDNVSKVASFVGGLEARLNSQEDLLTSQITNYKSAISRIEDVDVAEEQLDLVKNQFLQQTSIITLSQANQNPQTYLQLFG